MGIEFNYYIKESELIKDTKQLYYCNCPYHTLYRRDFP